MILQLCVMLLVSTELNIVTKAQYCGDGTVRVSEGVKALTLQSAHWFDQARLHLCTCCSQAVTITTQSREMGARPLAMLRALSPAPIFQTAHLFAQVQKRIVRT